MSGGLRVFLSRRRLAWEWFWDDLRHASRGRRWLVPAGNAGTVLCVVGALVYFWSREMTFGGGVVILLACLVCQAVALAPVAWPGRAATPRDVSEVSDLHQSWTVATVCGVGVFGVIPAAPVINHITGDANSPPMQALLVGGLAFFLAGTAGLITATAVSSRVRDRAREAERERRALDGDDLADDSDSTGYGSTDYGDVDAGDFGGAD
ncbi:hypothetical protein [Streptomyces ipomoeae]|uniref:hypothetical protein n=1 Tax=Streptomyces ipomoeae TaxID=103232 RepID=UPI00114654CD|nr:hypothetical protein [Streptomyces ipomoeae]MDX2937447.1 hypothetical protein [Streptomyces ipomoeae]TQE26659.1 hypothetical protein SipoB123_13680 [Streptomyces ipomoeae]